MSSRYAGHLLVLPALGILGLLALGPILWALWLSFQRRLLIFDISRFVGLENYWIALHDPRFWQSLLNTAYFTAVSVTAEIILGMAIALLIRHSFRGRGWVRAALLVPWAIPTVVSARMWEWMYNADFGFINFLLLRSGLVSSPLNWLGDRTLALHAAILMDVWKTTPFAAFLLSAALMTIPRDLYQAAQVDGAGAWAVFRRLTLPLLRPALLVVLLFRTLDAFRVFDAIYVLTGGGPANTTETLSVYTYKTLFQTLQFGYGSTLAVLTFLCVLLTSLAYLRFLRREIAY